MTSKPSSGCPFHGDGNTHAGPAPSSTQRTLDVEVPFAPVALLDLEQRAAVEAEALRLNDRYLTEFIEGHAFCPFAREGRQQGATTRHVHIYDEPKLDEIVQRMVEVAADESVEVAQLIFPLIDVSPSDWTRFCHEITALGHTHIGGVAILAVAPLHPELGYKTDNPFSLLTLFRRSPDPTIQWVRLTSLDQIYADRRPGTVVLSPEEIAKIIKDPQPQPNLYNRIAETNLAMAERIGFEKVEAMLAEIAAEGQRNYRRMVGRRMVGSE